MNNTYYGKGQTSNDGAGEGIYKDSLARWQIQQIGLKFHQRHSD